MCSLRYSFVLASTVLVSCSISNICLINADAVPAIFVFGDSLVDVGNNNYIKTKSKADKKHHGIDFGGPNGRFTNGRNIIDILGQKLGVKEFIPPYMAPTTTGVVVLKGVNYASGSSGILNDTGIRVFKNNINMDAQIDNFMNTRQTIIKLKGETGAKEMLRSNSLFPIVTGSNDLLNNYLIPVVSWSLQRRIPPPEFVSILITRLRKQLTRLYELDARKFVITELPPIGCIPYMIDRGLYQGRTGCHKRANNMALIYNTELKKLVNELRGKLEGSDFLYVRTYDILSDIIQNYKSFGFEKGDVACCRTLGKHGGLWKCLASSHVCRDRSKYIFWDGYHPSEATFPIVAKYILDGDASKIEPMNVHQLLEAPAHTPTSHFRPHAPNQQI